MINTKTLFIVLVLGLFSCRQSKTANNTVEQQPKPVNRDSFLVGEWGLCKELFLQDDGRYLEMDRNACPSLNFAKNNTGAVTMEGGTLIFSFTWSAENDKLIMQRSQNKKDGFLDARNYKLIYKNKKIINEVALFDTVRKIKYMLERSIN
ncbi:MAG: hypothetical protein ACHQIM_03010 [Sphingobacteriales bacterium]